MFDDLINLAKDTLSKRNKVRDGLPVPQAVVFTTDKSYTYVSIDDTVEDICRKLVSNHDTRIMKLLVMWKNQEIDLPSLALRKAIVEMNAENKDTNILLQGTNGFIVKKLSETLE